MPLFSHKDYKKEKLIAFYQRVTDLANKKSIIQKWQNYIKSGKIYTLTETQLDIEFVHDILGKVLGYEFEGANNWNIEIKPSSETDSTKPDATLGYYLIDNEKDTRTIIELKGAKIHLDKDQKRKDFRGTPVEQGFSYFPKFSRKCKWLIVSNYVEIRLYHREEDITKYETFFVNELLEEENLQKFLYLFSKGQLFLQKEEAAIEHLLSERRAEENTITNTFYAEYKSIREELFFHLHKHNPSISNEKLLQCTQKIIDRIIFMCFTRDTIPTKDILQRTQLAYYSLFAYPDDTFWQLLLGTFESYNRGFKHDIPNFNGGLFSEDKILNSLKVIDENFLPLIDFVLKYDFQSQLNVNILGHIFEQSISDLEEFKQNLANNQAGQVPQIQPDTLSKRKEDGIFYTPEYITHYMATQSISNWLNIQKDILFEKHKTENKEYWKEYKNILSNLTILDPACGSGAFLNAIFDVLYAQWQKIHIELEEDLPPVGNEIKGGLAFAVTDTELEWRTKKHIVSKNLYGVDLNAESIEITKLSLWLKTANKSVPLSDLSQNIRRGDSLISDKTVAPLAFEWEKAFPEVFAKGGFDIIIGNPPYVFAREKMAENEKDFYAKNYLSAQYQINTYLMFIELSIKLIKENGFLNLIIPDAVLMIGSASNLRNYLLENCTLQEIVHLSGHSFENVNVETVILHAQKTQNSNQLVKIFGCDSQQFVFEFEKKQSDFIENEKSEFTIYQNEESKLFLQKLQQHTLILDEVAQVKSGLKAYEKGMGIPKQTEYDVKNRIYDFRVAINADTFPYLEGKDVKRYDINWSGGYLQYGKNLAAPRTFNIFNGKKIIVREITGKYPRSIMATYTNSIYLFNLSNIAIIEREGSTVDLLYILGILNSKLMSYYFIKNTAKAVRKLFPKIILQDLRKFPIKVADTEKQAILIDKVKNLLDLYTQKVQIITDFWQTIHNHFPITTFSTFLENEFSWDWKTVLSKLKIQKIQIPLKEERKYQKFYESEQTDFQAHSLKIEHLEDEIDAFVFQLYGINEAEIRLIEAGI